MPQKYGRTYHLPLSPGATSDDKVMSDTSALTSGPIVVTEKMDGENTTIHCNGTHARSPDSRYHPSRDWLKAFAAGLSHQLGPNERIIGENLFARHSVAYDALPSYFLGFAWIKDGVIQSWPDTIGRFHALGITPVPTLYEGPYEAGLFDRIATCLNTDQQEGFVVRTVAAFAETDMPRLMGKYVRKDHVQTDTHWMQAELVPNGLG